MSFDLIVNWVKANNLHHNPKLICKLLFQAAVYYIWRERNSRLHSSSPKTSQSLVKEIQLLMRAKLAGLDRALITKRALSPGTPPASTQTLLYSWFELLQT
ncbi:unnamed protein product [Microthlaspi erraticum]|uniref:Reverse transcriptase zinc-binding domain-containing protein n=1 Tax=Microthlaspi erraticum TaxID=1685480 RepID=A0A6D2KJW0_9BRAS|nr:unnamed protein product [Microthlaspi erraticum]CAA7053506.1 unnamed protein product [Microthlaspi erraticum]